MSYNYNPQPPRVWSRVQHECSTINNSNNNIDNSNNIIPYEIEKQMLLKGNILQYKKNSSNLTKNQRYSKIAKGQWTNRTKSWATQSQTYSNPNTSSLLRVNYSQLPIPFNAILPLDCSSNFIKDGGNLICNKVVDPCTDTVIKTTNNVRCYSTTDSDVPGPIQELCWNNRVQTWYPRQNLTMNNSANKWPEGYKGLVSAVSPGAPYLMVDVSGNIANLSWKIIFNDCIPVNSFNIYKNGQFFTNVPYTTTSYSNILLNDCATTFYVTALSGVNESGPSNYVNAYIQPSFLVTGGSYTYNPSTELYTVVFSVTGTIKFSCCFDPITFVLVGGGGGGAGGSNTPSSIKGGAGGGGGQTNYFTTTSYTNNVIYNIVVGGGGAGGPQVGASIGQDGTSSIIYFDTTYTALGGEGGQASQGGGGGGQDNGGIISEPPSYSNGNGGNGTSNGIIYNGGGGGGGSDGGLNGSGTLPANKGTVAGGGGGGSAFNTTTGILNIAQGGQGGGGAIGGSGGLLYGGAGGNSDGSNGQNATGIGGGGGGGSGGQNNDGSGGGIGGNGGNGICILEFKLTYPPI
jgi:hypothetical protein